MIKIGNSIFIRKPNDVAAWRCKVIDKDEQYIYVDYPIQMEPEKSFQKSENEALLFSFITDEKVFEFLSIVKRYRHAHIPALAIKNPQEEKIKRIQRREFVRVKTTIDMAVHCPRDSFSPFITVTVDISGGGAMIIRPHTAALNLHQRVHVYFPLADANGNYEYIDTAAEIVRIEERKGVHTDTASVKFLFEHVRDQEKIIRFCFRKQREQRMQKIFE